MANDRHQAALYSDAYIRPKPCTPEDPKPRIEHLGNNSVDGPSM